MKVSRDHALYYHPYNHLSPQKMVAFSIHLCYSCMRCGVWRSLVARTAGGREVAGSNPVAPIFPINSRVSESDDFGFFYYLYYLFRTHPMLSCILVIISALSDKVVTSKV